MNIPGKVLNETQASLSLTFRWPEHTVTRPYHVVKKTGKYTLRQAALCLPKNWF